MAVTVPHISGFTTSTVTTLSAFPRKPLKLNSKANVSTKHPNLHRRDVALLSFLSHMSFLSLSSQAPASAIGISGPRDWLKEQKKKSSRFLLAPVDASRQILRSAYLLLTESGSDYTDDDLEKFQNLLRSAARDCVPQERNSFVTFQANIGVEVCTFRLIVNNAASLLGSKDPVKLKAEAFLDDLIRSFTSVSGLASKTNIHSASNRREIADAVADTLTSLDKFEQGIKDCLEI